MWVLNPSERYQAVRRQVLVTLQIRVLLTQGAAKSLKHPTLRQNPNRENKISSRAVQLHWLTASAEQVAALPAPKGSDLNPYNTPTASGSSCVGAQVQKHSAGWLCLHTGTRS